MSQRSWALGASDLILRGTQLQINDKEKPVKNHNALSRAEKADPPVISRVRRRLWLRDRAWRAKASVP